MSTHGRYQLDVFSYSIPDRAKQGFNIPHVTCGKGVGGSAVLDAMIYMRCTPSDMERWNITGWSWASMLDAFKQLEDATGSRSTAKYHGHFSSKGHKSDSSEPRDSSSSDSSLDSSGVSGEESLSDIFRIRTAEPSYVDGLSKEFIKSAMSFGLPFSNDFNDPNGGRRGVGYYDFNIRDGLRDSAAVRMLSPLIFKDGARPIDLKYAGEIRYGINEDRPLLKNYINGLSHKVYGSGNLFVL